MTTQPSFTRLVIAVLKEADRPLTIAEIKARVDMIRPVDTRNPQATIRGIIHSTRQAVSLGGRPARYTWWPRHLVENCYRQPLAISDLVAGTLVLEDESRWVLWSGLHSESPRGRAEVTLMLADGPVLETTVDFLPDGGGAWGVDSTPALADWYRQQEATLEDELIVRVVDMEASRYALRLCRRSDRDEAAIAVRNQVLADAAEQVLRAARPPTPNFELIPGLIARGAYRDPLPPDPWEGVLRADLRFIVGEHSVDLTEGVVNYLEREQEVAPSFDGTPRPRGDRRKARSDEARQAWGEYLFDRGMDHLWAGWTLAAEAYYQEALRLDPGNADAWAHLGNRRFEDGWLEEALIYYERGQSAAEVRTIGDPDEYDGVFWGDVRSRPFMRALHGRGMCLWRLGHMAEALQVFFRLLELNPDDNQGVRFILEDLEEGLSWEESITREEERLRDEEADWVARVGGFRSDAIH